MKKLLLILFSISLLGCLSHKDIAQAQSTMFEQIQLNEDLHKREELLRGMINSRLQIISMSTGGQLNGYASRVEISDSLRNNQYTGTVTFAVLQRNADNKPVRRVVNRKFIATIDKELVTVTGLAFDKSPFEP